MAASWLGAVVLAVAGCAAASPPAAAVEAAWGPWESLGGDVRSLPDCQRRGGTIDCWALSAGASKGSSLSWLRGDGEAWAPWVNLGGALRSGPECVSRGEEMDCFAPTAAVQGRSPLAWVHYDGKVWGSWATLGGDVKQKAACVAGPGREVACVALGNAETGLYAYRYDGRAWGAAKLLAFGGGTRSTLRPSCADTAQGLRCFAVDTTTTLRTILRDKRSGAWGKWARVTDGIGEPPHCLPSGTRLDCFSKSRTGAATQGRLVSGSFDGKKWGPWLAVGEVTVQSQPYCNALGSGFDCYWTSPEGDLRRRQRDQAGWLAEEDLGDGTVAARPECLATPGAPRVDCFVQGKDDMLHHRALD